MLRRRCSRRNQACLDQGERSIIVMIEMRLDIIYAIVRFIRQWLSILETPAPTESGTQYVKHVAQQRNGQCKSTVLVWIG